MKLNPTIRQMQQAVEEWYETLFKGTPEEHSHETLAMRFLEEAMELAQAMGVTRESALKQLEYTYGRPPGTVREEIAGTVMTLMHCGWSKKIDIQDAAVEELARINTPEMRQKIYDKQAFKRSKGLEQNAPCQEA